MTTVEYKLCKVGKELEDAKFSYYHDEDETQDKEFLEYYVMSANYGSSIGNKLDIYFTKNTKTNKYFCNIMNDEILTENVNEVIAFIKENVNNI